MPVVITNDVKDVLFREDQILTEEQLSSPMIQEERHNMQHDFGVANYNETYFDGFHFVHCNASVYQNLYVEATDMPALVSLLFMVRGQFVSTMNNLYKPYHISSLEHNLLFNPQTEEKAEIKKQEDIQVMVLGFTRERFLELAENNGRILGDLAEDVAGNKAAILNWKRNQPITNRMLMVMEEIRHCRFPEGLKKLFLQSKALELLALQCEQYGRVEERKGPGIGAMSAADKDRIYYARDLLLASAQQPPSLYELSRKAGINEFKLKRGFRTFFDNTVFGYLNDYRLDQARSLLQEQRKSLIEISEELGYSSPQHFSNAFKKKFGVSPGKARLQ